MKNFLKILIILLMPISIFGQNADKDTLPPKQTQVYLYNVFEKTLQALRVSIAGGSLSVAVSDSSNYANKEWAADSLTVTTEIDSIVAPSGVNTWWSVDIIGVADTLEFCLDSKAFIHPRRLFPNQSKFLEKLSVTTYPKIYIRRKGAYGACIYDIDMIGH